MQKKFENYLKDELFPMIVSMEELEESTRTQLSQILRGARHGPNQKKNFFLNGLEAIMNTLGNEMNKSYASTILRKITNRHVTEVMNCLGDGNSYNGYHTVIERYFSLLKQSDIQGIFDGKAQEILEFIFKRVDRNNVNDFHWIGITHIFSQIDNPQKIVDYLIDQIDNKNETRLIKILSQLAREFKGKITLDQSSLESLMQANYNNELGDYKYSDYPYLLNLIPYTQIDDDEKLGRSLIECMPAGINLKGESSLSSLPEKSKKIIANALFNDKKRYETLMSCYHYLGVDINNLLVSCECNFIDYEDIFVALQKGEEIKYILEYPNFTKTLGLFMEIVRKHTTLDTCKKEINEMNLSRKFTHIEITDEFIGLIRDHRKRILELQTIYSVAKDKIPDPGLHIDVYYSYISHTPEQQKKIDDADKKDAEYEDAVLEAIRREIPTNHYPLIR